jgi:Holin of 3TMs, for gene-transfer release
MAIPIIGDVINSVKDLISEVVVDKDKRAELNLELRKIEDQAQARLDAQILAQTEVNKVEAASSSLFVAGWRPAIGWVGAVALAYSFVVGPMLMWLATLFGYKGAMPVFQLQELMTLVMALLGIGGMRTYEKTKGVATDDLTTKKPDHENSVVSKSTVTTTSTTTEPVKKRKRIFGLV